MVDTNASQFSFPDPLAKLVEVFSEQLAQGNNVDLEYYTQRYPEYASQLEELLPAIEAMVIVGQNLQSTETLDEVINPRSSSQLGNLGDFQLQREIGRGGMGIVYEALQISLNRLVALKIFPFAAVLDKQHLQRFKNESLVAASLAHPNIVSVYSVGQERGVHFYAMQLVEGQSLAEVIVELSGKQTDKSLSEESTPDTEIPSIPADETAGILQAAISTTRSREKSQHYRWIAKLGIQAAEALAYAHENGVLHRDVKPGNVLLDANGDLYITDFGLARIETAQELTMTGDLLGTLRYMSPEQALGRREEIGERSDVYSLGATLYELTTLRPMFCDVDRQSLLHAIANREPARPRSIEPDLPHDLETILLKATAKEIGQRYSSAEKLAEDLTRFCENRPVLARRPTWVNRMGKWSRRHQSLVAALMLFMLLLSIVLGVSTVLINSARTRANIASAEAEQNAERLADLLYATDMQLAYQEWNKGWEDQVRVVLNRQQPAPNDKDRRGFEWHLLKKLTAMPEHFDLIGHDGAVNEVAVFSDGRRIASVGDDATLRIWDVPNEKLVSTVSLGGEGLHAVAISPDEKFVAVGGKRLFLVPLDNLDPKELLVAERTIESLAFHPDGDKIALGIRYLGVNLVTLEGELIKSVESDSRLESLQYMSSTDMFLVPVKDRQIGKLGSYTSDLEDAGLKFSAKDKQSELGIHFAHLSSDEKFLVTGDKYGTRIAICNSRTGELFSRSESVRSKLTSVAYSPAGDSVSGSFTDGTVRVWKLDSQAEGSVEINSHPQVLTAHQSQTTMVRYLNDHSLISASTDGEIRIWKLKKVGGAVEMGESNVAVEGICFSPDGKQLVAACGRHILFLDSQTGATVIKKTFKHHDIDTATWSPDGSYVAIATFETGMVEIFDLKQRKFTIKLKHGECAEDVDFSPDGKTLVSIGWDTMRLWDIDTQSEIKSYKLPEYGWVARYSHDGQRLAYGGRFGRIMLRNTDDDSLALELPCFNKTMCLAFNHDDSLLASGHEDGKIRLWDLTTGKLKIVFSGNERAVHEVVFSPDGRILASAGNDDTVRLWNVAMEQPIGVLLHRNSLTGIDFSPNGNRLVAGFKLHNRQHCSIMWSIENN